ncbi:MAG: hypothetical protein EOM34_13940 [Clostridia bacterium]|nr:alpha-E domain-containing protein [Lachnospiraceae bacterium]NCC01748.1 hypothetical protein [Clostridia bacterium]NCD03669.1 hypothetical protein [Clostridia bacterium]
MGIISVVKASNLLWLGRYSERVYTTLQVFGQYYDDMIDHNMEGYKAYCEQLSIPMIYESVDDFFDRYLFDEKDPNSVVSNLTRAVDNAIMLRNEISSTTLSYLEMALNKLQRIRNSKTALFEIQKVSDFMLAYWGCLDDYVLDDECRNLIKAGKYIERIDLYLRLDFPYDSIEREFDQLMGRLGRVHISYDYKSSSRLHSIILARDPEHGGRKLALECVNKFFEAY